MCPIRDVRSTSGSVLSANRLWRPSFVERRIAKREEYRERTRMAAVAGDFSTSLWRPGHECRAPHSGGGPRLYFGGALQLMLYGRFLKFRDGDRVWRLRVLFAGLIAVHEKERRLGQRSAESHCMRRSPMSSALDDVRAPGLDVASQGYATPPGRCGQRVPARSRINMIRF